MTSFSFPSFQKMLARLVPLLLMLFLSIALWMVLGGLKNGHYDPRAISAPAQNRPIPAFTAEPLLKETPSFTSETLKTQKTPVLVVFFSSWCITCIAEMPVLQQIQDQIPLWGVDYDDTPEKGRAFVEKYHLHFKRLNADQDGVIGANWGLTGVPESFLIMPGGKIAFHADGPMDMSDFELHIVPLLTKDKNFPSAKISKSSAAFPAP